MKKRKYTNHQTLTGLNIKPSDTCSNTYIFPLLFLLHLEAAAFSGS